MSEDYEMDRSVEELEAAVVGRRIVYVENLVEGGYGNGAVLHLDNGTKAIIRDTGSCCAYTELNNLLVNIENIENIITAVRTEDDYTVWHVIAGMNDVLTFDASWSEGTGYYSYGFQIEVKPDGTD